MDGNTDDTVAEVLFESLQTYDTPRSVATPRASVLLDDGAPFESLRAECLRGGKQGDEG